MYLLHAVFVLLLAKREYVFQLLMLISKSLLLLLTALSLFGLFVVCALQL